MRTKIVQNFIINFIIILMVMSIRNWFDCKKWSSYESKTKSKVCVQWIVLLFYNMLINQSVWKRLSGDKNYIKHFWKLWAVKVTLSRTFIQCLPFKDCESIPKFEMGFSLIGANNTLPKPATKINLLYPPLL